MPQPGVPEGPADESPPLRDDTTQGLARQARIDQVCEAFEEAWLSGAGPELEPYLARLPEADQPALARELVRLDLDYRRKAGQAPGAEEYRARLPGQAAAIASVFAGPAEPLDTVASAFQLRCP